MQNEVVPGLQESLEGKKKGSASGSHDPRGPHSVVVAFSHFVAALVSIRYLPHVAVAVDRK